MAQKLSAMKYIKNNKRRVSVLIVSMALCFILFYLINFLLSVTIESDKIALVTNAEKMQYINIPVWYLGLDANYYEENGEEAFINERYNSQLEFAEELKEKAGIIDVFYSNVYYVDLSALVGSIYVECPMITADNLEFMLEYYDASIIEGRLPEQPGEVVVDNKLMKNNGYQIGDVLRDYTDAVIVGIVESDYYLAFGMGDKDNIPIYNPMLVVLTDGSIENMTDIIEDMIDGFDAKDAYIGDIVNGKKDVEKDVVDAINSSTRIIYVSVILILSITLVILYATYLRDRLNEWCLYSSIGFERSSIYAMVMKELFITFGIALIAGIIFTVFSVIVLGHTMISKMGLVYKYFYPEMIVKIICIYVLIIGLLQLPIRIYLSKIKTIDAMDDDLLK